MPDPGGADKGVAVFVSAETPGSEEAEPMGGAADTAAAASAMAAVSAASDEADICWEDCGANRESEALIKLTDIPINIRQRHAFALV